MRRLLVVALIIGAVSALATLLLHQFGLFEGPARRLATFYTNHGFLSHPKEAGKILHFTVVVILAFITSWCAIDIPRVAHKVIVIVGLVLLVCFASAAPVVLEAAGNPNVFERDPTFFEPFSSLAVIALASILGLVYASTEHGARKRTLQSVLGGRISEHSFNQLLEGGRPHFLNGHNREVSILTVRVFNHAELRRDVAPADLIEMTNLFLQNSSEFLTSRGAYIDESSPDCVRVYFGVISRVGDHVEQACDAALELRQRLRNLDTDMKNRFFHSLRWGIAISASEMTLGIYQSENATRLSAVGEVVEFVRKLSAANSRYGSEILVSSGAYARIQERYAVRPMEMIFDSSIELMSEVYELVDLKAKLTEADEAARQQFWKGVILYREGRGEEALEIFSALFSESPNDRPLAYFTDRAQTNMVDAPKNERDVDAHLIHGHARVLHTL
ncbi:MAG: class 3 adenylate cyclase [Verrucomicrobiales bacterium]|jgi:class 3 adenylate cyclase